MLFPEFSISPSGSYFESHVFESVIWKTLSVMANSDDRRTLTHVSESPWP